MSVFYDFCLPRLLSCLLLSITCISINDVCGTELFTWSFTLTVKKFSRLLIFFLQLLVHRIHCTTCVRINDVYGTFLKTLSLCLSTHLPICRAKCKGSAWVLSWNSGPVCMFIHSFCQYQILLLCYRGNGLLEGFYIQQLHDPELTACQRELKFNALPVTPPRYVTRLYVCRKNLWQVYQTDNSILWDRFTLPNTTQDSDQCWLRIYEWIPYRHCRMSVQYCVCVRFPLFHNVHICICSFGQESAVAHWLRLSPNEPVFSFPW